MSRQFKIALVGNPNSGKTTLFNILTGLNQKVANFPGVTVDKKTGSCDFTDPELQSGFTAEVIDLPGTYSLYPKSIDEGIPFKVLCDIKDESHPDLTVIVADASNLKRSLFLCTQVIDLGKPVILALNMMDQVAARGQRLDIKGLEAGLGIPVFGLNARKKEGIRELKKGIIRSLESLRAPAGFTDIAAKADEAIRIIRDRIEVSSDYAAFLIANNLEYTSFFQIREPGLSYIEGELRHASFSSKKLQAMETLERYTRIGKITDACLIGAGSARRSLTRRFDRLLTHRIFGFIFFLLIMFLLFQAVFAWSEYPMEIVEEGFLLLNRKLELLLPEGILRDLLLNGILAGLGGIIVFIPQIALLFAFIGILEDTGYMARVSFIMDKMMRRFGLNGKSVIPLISGVACAVPAIMATRTIQNRRERILTIMVTPLMSCSARIPVYTLLIGLVIPERTVYGFVNLQGLVLMLLYLLGFVAAIASAWILKFVVLSRERSYFIMEMPVYRMPRWSNIGYTILEKVKIFLFDAGKIIIAISVVLWVLSSYGPGNKMERLEMRQRTPVLTSPGAMSHAEDLQRLQSEKLSASYAGMIGRWLEPVIEPLGFDWKIGIALVTSFAAREVFVGTMATIYSVGDDSFGKSTVKEKMLADRHPETGKPVYTLAAGLSLMIFYAFAMQCMSTVSVVYRETKNLKWPLLQIIYMSGLAYVSSLLVYHGFGGS
jgi:ferrous iron transport protein B